MKNLFIAILALVKMTTEKKILIAIHSTALLGLIIFMVCFKIWFDPQTKEWRKHKNWKK